MPGSQVLQVIITAEQLLRFSHLYSSLVLWQNPLENRKELNYTNYNLPMGLTQDKQRLCKNPLADMRLKFDLVLTA